jgi:uncharacterized membrane protein
VLQPVVMVVMMPVMIVMMVVIVVVIMTVIVAAEKFGLDVEDAIEVKGIAAEHFR